MSCLLPAIHLRSRHIAQGEYAIGNGQGGAIATILGSCVASCMYDPMAQVGGMNHFLVPDGFSSTAQSASYGINAMELLINALIKQGANRARLQAKVFGGARMISGLTDIGAKNGEFVLAFLRREGITCVNASLGGNQARRIEFWPETGRARQRILAEARLEEHLVVPVTSNDVELF